MDARSHNRNAWNKNVLDENPWTIPVSTAEVDRARKGEFQILLTPTKPTPMNWFPPLAGLRVLCLASGGGQQGPILAAAGADVTVFDNSPKQLGQDRLVAERDGLTINTVEGDMADLSCLADESFALIVHPCSNCFVPELNPIWRECFRVLECGGAILSGFCNPVRFIFEDSRLDNGVLRVCYSIPHSDLTDRSPDERQQLIEDCEVLEFGHTLQDQIGGQLAAGFHLTGFYEDRYMGPESDPISDYLDTFMATRAIKPK